MEMKNHVKEMHDSPGDNVELTGTLRTVLRNISETSSFRQVMFTLNEIFYVIWELRDSTFYCATFHIGPKENACKFSYRFRISKKRGKECIAYCLQTHSYMENVNDVIEKGDCVSIHYNCVEKFIKNSALPFEIQIFNNRPYKRRRNRNDSYYVSGDCNDSSDNDTGDNGLAGEVEND